MIQNGKEGMSVQKLEKQPLRLSKQWMIGLLLLSVLFLAACGNNDNNGATNTGNDESLHTNPNNGTNNGNGTDMNNNGTNNRMNNGTNENGVYDGSNNNNNNNGTPNQTNEGTIKNHDTLQEEAQDVIDDTKDMIEGKDNKVNNPQRNVR